MSYVSITGPKTAVVLRSCFSIGVPVNPMKDALGSASLKFFAKPSMKSYWLRCASSAITITLRLAVSVGYCSSFSSGRNFCAVVNIIPPDARFSSAFNCSLDAACTGSSLKRWLHLQNVP